MQSAGSAATSFKEKLLGGLIPYREENFEDWYSKEEEEENRMEEDQDPECPSISVRKEEKRRLRMP